MELTGRIIKYKVGDLFKGRAIGDIHAGTRHHDEKHFASDVKEVYDDPQMYWLGTGDYIEAIAMSDPRFMAQEVSPRFVNDLGEIWRAQRDYIIERFAPIADKCLGLIVGNHEHNALKRYHVDVVRDMCKTLDVPYLGSEALIRLTFQRDTPTQPHSSVFVISACHGSGGGRTTGGKINRAIKKREYIDADLYIRGHNHDILPAAIMRLSVPRKGNLRLIAREQRVVISGCYYRTYEVGTSSYGEIAEYPPTKLGSPLITYNPETGDTQITF